MTTTHDYGDDRRPIAFLYTYAFPMTAIAAPRPERIKDATPGVKELILAGILCAGMIGGLFTVLSYFADHVRDIVAAEVKPLAGRVDGVEKRLDGVEARLDRMDARFDRVEARLDRVELKIDKLGDQIGALAQVVARQAGAREGGLRD